VCFTIAVLPSLLYNMRKGIADSLTSHQIGLTQIRAVARPATRSGAPGGASVPDAAAPGVSL